MDGMATLRQLRVASRTGYSLEQSQLERSGCPGRGSGRWWFQRDYNGCGRQAGAGMDVQIHVADGPGGELAALGEWLGGEGELCGRVRLCSGPVGDTDPGSIPDLLIVTLGAGGTGKVLASSLITWLQSRRTTARITVESGGRHVTLDIHTAGKVGPLLEQILRVGNAGAALADVRRAQAGRLIDHAVLAAHLSGNENLKTHALVRAAETLAATDPDRAERIARSITIESQQGSALGNVVEALIPDDLDRARHVARSIRDDYSRQSALSHIAEALAVTDPDQAIQLIEWSITIDQLNASALGRVAKALAATDPGQAERIALSITDTDAGESALGEIASVGLVTRSSVGQDRLPWRSPCRISYSSGREIRWPIPGHGVQVARDGGHALNIQVVGQMTIHDNTAVDCR
jgi:Effector Associated Constant Component 1